MGKATLETAAMISGGTEGVKAIGLYPSGGAEDVEAALRKQISEMNRNDTLLCRVDIPGGSPARCGKQHNFRPRQQVTSEFIRRIKTE